ncbi:MULTISPECIES: hypothetical protein [unclassified Roseobacter]|uniref:hypothetical protein n=1 Tax=unclassified Roseobacter TaxID=196798 RepID=UPI0018A2D5B3|nr:MULTISPECIES: hypothetical protein [unclassified Roseobacter]MDW3181816.1 hypothetical protein [Roseobacter sp.]
MRTFSFRIICALGLATALVACDDSNGPVDGLTLALQSLGSDFQAAFNQGRNDTPIDVDMVRLTLDRTAEPFEF